MSSTTAKDSTIPAPGLAPDENTRTIQFDDPLLQRHIAGVAQATRMPPFGTALRSRRRQRTKQRQRERGRATADRTARPRWGGSAKSRPKPKPPMQAARRPQETSRRRADGSRLPAAALR